MKLLNISGWIFGLVSFLIAIKEFKERTRISKLIRSNNWMLYQRTSNLGGTIQKALNKMEDNKEIDIEIIENIIRSDALCGELIKENIRLIQSFEPSFTKHDLDRWNCEGKISDGYKEIFKMYIVD